jgi:tetratricopeptide (TPR) repeat protein
MAKAPAGILDSDSAETVHEKLELAARNVLPDPTEAGWVERHLRPLVGLEEEAVIGGDHRTEAFAAWRRYFEALAADRPLVLAFEDLHWANDGLLDFVDELVDWAREVPIVVLATARPELLERRPEWAGGKTNALTISLSALSREETSELIEALLGRAELPALLAAALYTRAAGNPLYANEYVRMLSDRGLLRRLGSEGAQLARLDELPLPETVQGLIAARLDTLDADVRTLLQDSAVVGPVFWPGAVAEVGGLDRDIVARGTDVLERRELIRRERRSAIEGEPQFAFRHVLVRDVAYSQIPRARRAEKHRLAAEWIESVASDRSLDQAELLAHHYSSAFEFASASGQDTGSLAGRAQLATRNAGDRAAALNGHSAAARFYAQSLALLPRDDPDRGELLYGLGTARFHAELEGQEELIAARDSLLARGDQVRAADAELTRGELLANQGLREEAREALDNAASLLEGLERSQSKAHVLASSARFLLLAGETERAVSVGHEALEMAEAMRLEEIRAQTLMTIGFARVTGGDSGGSVELAEGLEAANAINSAESVRGYRFLASAYMLLGEIERGAQLFEEGRRAAERFGDAFNQRWLIAAGSLEAYWLGDWERAQSVADSFIAECEAGAPHYMEALARRVRGSIRLARGDVEGAALDAERGLSVSRLARVPWFYNPALAALARVRLELGDADAAATLASELLERWREGPRVLLSTDAVDLATVLDALGRGPELIEAAAGATTRTQWVDAAALLVEHRYAEAATAYAAIGSRPDEAAALLREGERLLAEGNDAAGTATVTRALKMLRSLGADAWVREAESLLA